MLEEATVSMEDTLLVDCVLSCTLVPGCNAPCIGKLNVDEVVSDVVSLLVLEMFNTGFVSLCALSFLITLLLVKGLATVIQGMEVTLSVSGLLLAAMSLH